MSRITEESIRIKAMEVQREMALLKAFTNRHGEHTNLCIVHDWHLGETEAPVSDTVVVQQSCIICGLERARTFKWSHDTFNDPYKQLRPESEEE
jgi:hypothetical protein